MSVNKLKVMTVVGTRPELIRLSRVIIALSQHCEHILVHTGQNFDYELNQVFFDDLKIPRPNYFLDSAASSSGPANTIGNIISNVDPILASEAPDALLVLGDTNSCLSAIPAKRRKIPIFHMEAGNRCFDQRVPEETNRRIVDHIADINLTYSSIAREYLISEGLRPDFIIKTGSPMYEVLQAYREEIAQSKILETLELSEKEYFVVSAHREENIESEHHFVQLVNVLNDIAEYFNLPVLVSTHPRTRNKINTAGVHFHKKVKLLKPLGFHDYIKLQCSAKAVLSDSGTISEESSILGFPALNLREAHERPEAMETAAVMLVGLSSLRAMQALQILDKQVNSKVPCTVDDYMVPDVSLKVVRLILSYTDYVNRIIWQKK